MTAALEPTGAAAPDASTLLAIERTYLAHERTQLAWLRTALALISFGFTIAKFFDFLREKQGEAGPVFSPRTVGTIMIAIGLVSLALADVQNRKAMRRLRAQEPDLPMSVAIVTGWLMAGLGVLALFGAVVRQ